MRVLLVSTRFPLPARRGQQIRTVEWLAALRDREVALVCPEGPDGRSRIEGVRVFSSAQSTVARVASAARFAGAGTFPVQEAMYATPGARRAVVRALDGVQPDLVIIQMVRCAWAVACVRRMAPGTPILFDAVDAMGLHYRRAAEAVSAAFRPVYRLEARRCAARERSLAARAALTVAVSDRDVEALGTPRDRGWAVPVSGRAIEAGRDPDPAPTVLLSGNLGYRPTIDAARWFASTVWPGLKARLPEARWLLAGARPAASVRALGRLDGVEVHGDVADLAPFMARSWVSIAPMASGSGVPIKILEAWAAGVPVIAHPWTAGGLASGCREAVCVADESETWIRTVSELVGDSDRRAWLAERGLEMWRRHYAPEIVTERIRAAVDRAAGASATRASDRSNR